MYYVITLQLILILFNLWGWKDGVVHQKPHTRKLVCKQVQSAAISWLLIPLLNIFVIVNIFNLLDTNYGFLILKNHFCLIEVQVLNSVPLKLFLNKRYFIHSKSLIFRKWYFSFWKLKNFKLFQNFKTLIKNFGRKLEKSHETNQNIKISNDYDKWRRFVMSCTDNFLRVR